MTDDDAANGCGWLWMDGNHCHEGARWKVRLLLLRLMIDWCTKTSEQWGSDRRKRKEEAIKQYQTISIEHDTVSLNWECVCSGDRSFWHLNQPNLTAAVSSQRWWWSDQFAVAFDGGGGGHFAAVFVALSQVLSLAPVPKHYILAISLIYFQYFD